MDSSHQVTSNLRDQHLEQATEKRTSFVASRSCSYQAELWSGRIAMVAFMTTVMAIINNKLALLP
jgi:hypothetical protein